MSEVFTDQTLLGSCRFLLGRIFSESLPPLRDEGEGALGECSRPTSGGGTQNLGIHDGGKSLCCTFP